VTSESYEVTLEFYKATSESYEIISESYKVTSDWYAGTSECDYQTSTIILMPASVLYLRYTLFDSFTTRDSILAAWNKSLRARTAASGRI
jgi:hypothetical protein